MNLTSILALKQIIIDETDANVSFSRSLSHSKAIFYDNITFYENDSHSNKMEPPTINKFVFHRRPTLRTTLLHHMTGTFIEQTECN